MMGSDVARLMVHESIILTYSEILLGSLKSSVKKFEIHHWKACSNRFTNIISQYWLVTDFLIFGRWDGW